MKHTLSVLVEDESGALSRISGLFARRGFNIDSLAVGPAESKGISRLTMVVEGDDETLQQMTKQLNKLFNVLGVVDFTNLAAVERELMLLKVSSKEDTRSNILDIVQIFRAKVVDVSDMALTLEVVGDPGKLVALEKLLEPYGILEIARTGKVALKRSSGVNTEMLKINKLNAKIDSKEILKEFSLNINPGEVHAIMGPNGSGKSTLSNILSGKKGYEVSGEVLFEEKDLFELETEERAHKGIFLAFQYPLEIPGVNTNIFLKTSLNAVRKARGEKELDAIEFLKLVKEKSKELKFDEEKLNRQLNVGFSGGEKKKNEILQMSLLAPKLSILDETDSGLDIDALKIVADGVNTLRDQKNSFLIITHYQRLLDYIKPDFVHVLMDGKIVKSGGAELALELEKKGYENFH